MDDYFNFYGILKSIKVKEDSRRVYNEPRFLTK